MLHKRKDGSTVFVNGKWVGKSLVKIAEEDPSYLTWLYRKASGDLNQNLFHELQDVMKEHKIPFDFPERDSHSQEDEEP